MARPAVYTFEGHGCEIPGDYKERFTLPPNITLVTFSSCGRSVYMKDSSWIFEESLHTDLTVQSYFEDPMHHIEHIEEITKKPIRIYPPGSKVPDLYFMPYSNFPLSNFETDPFAMDGELVSLSGIIPLFEMKTTNEKWKNLHDEPAEEAGLDSEGGWCYTTAPEKDEDSGEINPEEIVVVLPNSQFSESVEEGQLEYIPYTELIYGNDYRDITLNATDRIPDDVYNYIYRHSVNAPSREENIRNLSISMTELFKRITGRVVIYWNVCRMFCKGISEEQKRLAPFIREKSSERQRNVRKGAVSSEFDAAEAFLKVGGKRRKTFRKNLRKSRKSKRKWTQTRRSKLQR